MKFKKFKNYKFSITFGSRFVHLFIRRWKALRTSRTFLTSSSTRSTNKYNVLCRREPLSRILIRLKASSFVRKLFSKFLLTIFRLIENYFKSQPLWQSPDYKYQPSIWTEPVEQFNLNSASSTQSKVWTPSSSRILKKLPWRKAFTKTPLNGIHTAARFGLQQKENDRWSKKRFSHWNLLANFGERTRD